MTQPPRNYFHLPPEPQDVADTALYVAAGAVAFVNAWLLADSGEGAVYASVFFASAIGLGLWGGNILAVLFVRWANRTHPRWFTDEDDEDY